MKILKIELQNINSLRADVPIVIDFENAKFKDVGLYAITGSTGAGKTTLLDAITIALYHSVPRFKKSHVKAGLEDVISHGAGEALSRVTFENAGDRFEAQWSMRKTDKKGKAIKPKEEVRFKNLTTEKILAEKKTEVRTEVERVTQLNYDQFLRSVMLAQGDFASFLSAPSKDKATLLEQITGEDIYKKIGDAINLRKGEETQKLEAIKSQVNDMDTLSLEQEEALTEEKKQTLSSGKELGKELIQLESILVWYQKMKELLANVDQLAIHLHELEKEKEECKEQIQVLAQHKKAEPCREQLSSIQRNEQETKTKSQQLLELEAEQTVLLPKLNESAEKKKELQTKHEEAEQTLNTWLPKLEEVSKLDADIKNINVVTNDLRDKNSQFTQIVDSLTKEIRTKDKEFNAKVDAIKELESYLDQFKHLPEIEKEFPSWNRHLTHRKTNREYLLTGESVIKEKEKELGQVGVELKSSKEKTEEELLKAKQLEQELETLESELKTNGIEELLTQKEQLSVQLNNLGRFKSLALTFKNKTNLFTELDKEQKKIAQKITNQEQLLKDLKASLEKSKLLLQDAQKILELEQSILSLEEERKKLVDGEPCALCGSTEHPFALHDQEIKLSDSQARIAEREKDLNRLMEQEREQELSVAQLKTTCSNNEQQLEAFTKELDNLKQEADALGVGLSINGIEEIEIKTHELDLELKEVAKKLTSIQSIQEIKNTKSNELQIQKDLIHEETTNLARLEEKEKNLLEEVTKKKNELAILEKETTKLEASLSTSLDKFKTPLPKVERTEIFLEKVQHKISEYNSKNKQLEEAKHLKEQFAQAKKNSEVNLKEKEKESKVVKDELNKNEENLKGLSIKRVQILPKELTVESKRSELLHAQEEAKKSLEIVSGELQELLTKQTTNKKERENKTEEIDELTTTYQKAINSFSEALSKSDFDSREELQNALLTLEEVTRIEKIKEHITNRSIELGTLQTKLKNDLAEHEKLRSFDLAEEVAQKQFEEQKTVKEGQLKRIGEIDQQFELNNQIKERNKTVFNQIKEQEQELKKWADLIKLIGGSKDAFNTYVQRLTLQNLIHLANKHLFNLNKRYSLKMKENYKTGEELNFNIIDHYQMDEVRYIDTSSGGEKFLISLSLALGLSDLASHNVQIDSLFIDEGFGTLDNHTLESVISTLETLQSQGKMIGVISHVESLKERISTQVQVRKKQNGVSEVEVVG